MPIIANHYKAILFHIYFCKFFKFSNKHTRTEFLLKVKEKLGIRVDTIFPVALN